MNYNGLLPGLNELRSYMLYQGWSEGAPGNMGSLWPKDGTSLGIPFTEDEDIIRGVVERLAFWRQLPVGETAEKIKYFHMDVTELRSAADGLVADTIPLETASAITGAAKTMLRSAASTAVRPRGDLRSNYSRLSIQFAKDARMGHTKRGSFIIPVIVPLPVNHETILNEQALIAIDRSLPEPYERRALRTLAQSLKAIEDIIVEPAQEPTMDSLHAVVELGVSRELCSAVGEVLAQPVVGEFDANFAWAESVRVPTTIPSEVHLNADSRDLIEMAASKLQSTRIEPPRVFSGNIVELRHETDDPVGFVSISTMRNGRRAEIRIRLSYDRYLEALQWHRQSRAILVEGEVSREHGRLHIVSPSRCHPIDELYLPVADD